jgi:dihydropteroate synthase
MHSDLHVTPRSWAGLRLDRPLVMGILNLTSDSFSGAGPADPIAAGRALRDAGADIVDIGAESTRPGAGPVPAAEQIARVTAVIAALCRDGPVSIDTRSAAVMAAALQAGATIINDVSGLTHDPAAAALVAAAGCPVIIMHMRGSPATMSCQAHYRDLVRDVLDELLACRDRAVAAGVKPEMIALDPGFGFAKRGAQNVRLLQALPRFAALGHPLVVGVSRKKFIGEATGAPDPQDRLGGSLAAALYAAAHGAHILRVHDVAQTAQALRMWQTLNEDAD